MKLGGKVEIVWEYSGLSGDLVIEYDNKDYPWTTIATVQVIEQSFSWYISPDLTANDGKIRLRIFSDSPIRQDIININIPELKPKIRDKKSYSYPTWRYELQDRLGLEQTGKADWATFEALVTYLNDLDLMDDQLEKGYDGMGGYLGFQIYLDNNQEWIMDMLRYDEDYGLVEIEASGDTGSDDIIININQLEAHWSPPTPTDQYHLIMLGDVIVAQSTLDIGMDEVGIFDGDLLVGAVSFSGEPGQQILAWADDETTEEVDGFTAGNTITFKLYDFTASTELEPVTAEYIDFPNWDTDGLFGTGNISGVNLSFNRAPYFVSDSVTTAKKQVISVKDLAKTFESMKPDEIKPILANLDDSTVIAIYNSMSGQSKKLIFKALNPKRAAEITKILAAVLKPKQGLNELSLTSPLNTTVANTTPILKWDALEGAFGYLVAVSMDGYIIWSDLIDANEVTYPAGASPLSYEFTYSWSVQAVDDSYSPMGNKPESTFTTPAFIHEEISNWRKLEVGMSFDDVKKLLGEPKRVKGGGFTYYYYRENRYNGRLTFYNGRLEGWTEPDW